MWTSVCVDESLPEDQKQKLHTVLHSKIGRTLKEREIVGKEVKNVMVYKENHLFVWCFDDESIYCFWMKDERRVIGLQTLALTNPPLFDVESLVFSASGRYLAVLGSRGINIVELPHKWGSRNGYEAGKSTILCRCWCLDERFFVCNQKILLLDASWHPASRDEKHIVLLTNDNCLRMYSINEPHIVHQEIKLSNCDSIGKTAFSVFASSLGETAVSFDFGLPLPKCSYKCNEDEQPLTLTSSECLWPIYVLKGNGDVLLVYTHLENTYLSERVLGPLTMLPAAEDNYGLDACRLICLDSLPQIIVIATSSGVLYHCIALTGEDCDTDASMLPKPTLFVHESVELTLSLTSFTDEDLLCPIRLYRDPLGAERYFCSHGVGIHAISLPIAKRLSGKRLNLDNIDKSVVEHLICTKPIASSDESSVVPLGVDVILRKGQSHIKVLLSNGDIITQRLSLLLLSRNEETEENDAEAWLQPKVEFSDYVTEILKRNTSAPLLKSNADTVADNEKNLQLLLNTTEVFREEYLSKMSVAAIAIERRVKNLVAEKKLQFDELSKCEEERKSLLMSAKQLTDKYDSILERQNELSMRLDDVLELLQSRQTEMSDAEIQMLKDLRSMKEKLIVYRNQVEKVKLKIKYQEEMDSDENTTFASLLSESGKHLLSKVQMKNISNVVSQERESIANLLQRILNLKQCNVKH